MREVTSAPTVSIGMPVYNGEKYIRQALDSLLAQTHKNFELIISDNASTDNTQEVSREYAKNDERINYHRCKTNNGAAWNFNRVVELSSGKYFMWASHDDYWEQRYIEVCLSGFESSDNIVLSGTWCKVIKQETDDFMVIDKGLTTIGQKPSRRFMNYKKMIQGFPNTNCIFYGLYRSDTLSKLIPLKKIIGGDHVLLANSTFLGEIITSQQILHIKRYGGPSRSHEDNARAIGINNLILIKLPYLVREFYLQKIIYHTDRLTNVGKIKLTFWSLFDFLIYNVLRGFYFSLRRTISRPIKVLFKRS